MKCELPTDDAINAQDPAFEAWWEFFKGAQGLEDRSIRVPMGVRVFARCVWLAAQAEKRRAPNCPVCGAAPLTLCAPGCTYAEQMNELAASTLEGLSDDEKRIVTSRAAVQEIDVEAFQRWWEQVINEPDADCPECGVQPAQFHKPECGIGRRAREGGEPE